MIFRDQPLTLSQQRLAMNSAYHQDETQAINHLLAELKMPSELMAGIQEQTKQFVIGARELGRTRSALDSFLFEYDLSSDEGIALMCLAEALLRIPDKTTIDRLIRDKLTAADWHTHLKHTDSYTVNAATWALMLTGKVLTHKDHDSKLHHLKNTIKRIITRSGEPVIRNAVGQAMKIMSKQFVMGRTIEEAMSRAKHNEKKGYRYSFDMLGESALTEQDAQAYFEAYSDAVAAIGQHEDNNPISGPGISIKLSALHPRYEVAQYQAVRDELIPKVFSLARLAKEANIGLTIDAEESERLDLSLDVFESVFLDPCFDGWEGFGLALQSYQKRAYYVIDYLAALSNQAKRRINVRLIKGAYWDREIKHAQQLGVSDYPVFTRKYSTDVSFLACAQKILQYPDNIYPQFATHNAFSVSAVLAMVGDRKDYEFQCLHGMGQELYEQIVGADKLNIPCRIYAPVGTHEDLLPYLVRRLLENGANSSFVNRLADDEAPVESLCVNPIAMVQSYKEKAHPNIPLPSQIYQQRSNSKGLDLSDISVLTRLDEELACAANKSWQVSAIVGGKEKLTRGHDVISPSNNQILVGQAQDANEEQIEQALALAHQAQAAWDEEGILRRADCLDRTADLFEKHIYEFMYLAIFEAGKSIQDALGEVREAVDFCRYYAKTAREQLLTQSLQGVTGELNELSYHGQGVIACISPWNFPLAIFTGQVSAALVTGNCVIAKPAEQTPLIAGLAVRLFQAAGVPGNVLHLLPGKGEVVGAKLTSDARIHGVVFTGSTDTAKLIQQSLSQKPGPIAPLIAETGGQNAMIVDSSALPEQVVTDVIASAFLSAGQRCSACRVLFLQDVVAPKIITMLRGAMQLLQVDNPALLSTDIGPVIDAEAKVNLERHFEKMMEKGELLQQLPLPESCRDGTFFAPCLFEIDDISVLEKEVFGPVLHIIRYRAKDLDKVIDAINQTGYGLTLGIHSRINETIDRITRKVRVGNAYVNRNMIGAVVGVQPFGGEGLSGTGPKAGGPNYLKRLSVERCLTVDTTAAGGNASLLALQAD